MKSTTEPLPPRIVSRTEWLVARQQHLAREKEFTRNRDQLSRERGLWLIQCRLHTFHK